MRTFFFGFLVVFLSGVMPPAHVRAEFLTFYDALTGGGSFAGLSFGVFGSASLEELSLLSIGGFGNLRVDGRSIENVDGRPVVGLVLPGGGFSTGYDLTYLPYDLGMRSVPTVLGWWSGLQVGLSFTVMIPGGTPNAALPVGPEVQFPQLGVLDEEVNVDGVLRPKGTPRLSMMVTEEIRLSLLSRLGIISFDYVALYGLFGYTYSKGNYRIDIPVSSVDIDAGLSKPLSLGVLRSGFRVLRYLDFPTEFHGVSYGGGAEFYIHSNLSFQLSALQTFYPTVSHREDFLLRYLPSLVGGSAPIFYIQRSSLFLKAEVVYRF